MGNLYFKNVVGKKNLVSKLEFVKIRMSKTVYSRTENMNFVSKWNIELTRRIKENALC